MEEVPTMNTDDTKRCAKCWRYLPLGEFGHDGRTRDNLTYRCNDCRTIVPNAEQSGSETTDNSSDRNDRAAHGTFVANPHFHGEH